VKPVVGARVGTQLKDKGEAFDSYEKLFLA
jgi:hypothetical protein